MKPILLKNRTMSSVIEPATSKMQSKSAEADPIINGSIQQRLPNIDAAKGIGILMVVHGHLSGFVVDAIFLVHMPLFFVIAGMLSKNDPSIGVARRVLSIAVPYFAFLLVLWLIPSMVEYLRGDISHIELLKRIAKAIIGGETLIAIAAVFWFPSAYALMLAFVALIYKLNRACGILVLLTTVSIATTLSVVWPDFYLPLALNVVPIAVVFYFIGRAFRQHDFGKTSVVNVLMLLIGILALFAVEASYSPTINMKRADYGVPVFTLLLSASGVLAILVFSTILSKWNATKFIAYIGRASLFIMYAHMAIAIELRSNLSLPGSFIAIMTIAICLLSYELVRSSRLLSVTFLGKIPDHFKFRDSKYT